MEWADLTLCGFVNVDFELIVIVIGWMIAGGSPGPATLAISGTSMAEGRGNGLAIAAGIVVGSACWGGAAGLGVSTVMMANVWLFEVLRYFGAAYLLYLAAKSLRADLRGAVHHANINHSGNKRQLFGKGLLIHLTNPKAILSWGAIYSIALPPHADVVAIFGLFGTLIIASMVVFFGYALLFSIPSIVRGYLRARRAFELTFALLFGGASLRILTS